MQIIMDNRLLNECLSVWPLKLDDSFTHFLGLAVSRTQIFYIVVTCLR